MGLTLVAILTAALLLPGIIASKSFYRAGQTREVEAVMPALSTAEGVALVGGFSVAVHTVYVILLAGAALLPDLIPVPLSNPYLLFEADHDLPALTSAWLLFSGLTFLSLTAVALGYAVGAAMFR